MAKKLRFPLEMENGVEVRTLEELKENFSIGKVYLYYKDGKLITWLRDRYLDDLVREIEALDTNSTDFVQKLCEVFNVEYVQNSVDLEVEEERNQRVAKVKEFTSDNKYIDGIAQVAFDQDELYDLLDEGIQEIFLCGERFEIPLSKTGISYEGINNPTVMINSSELVDWGQIGITIKKVQFNEAYQKILARCEKENTDVLKKNDLIEDYFNLNGEDLLKRIEAEIDSQSPIADKARYMLERFTNYSPKAANETKFNVKEQLKTASDNGYKAAVIRYAMNYLPQNEREEIYSDIIQKNSEGNLLSADEEKDMFVLYELGIVYLNDEKMKQNSIEYIRKAADNGCWMAEISMGVRYENGGVVEKNYYKAMEWYKKVADKGLAKAQYYVSDIAVFNVINEESLGQEYIVKAFEDKDFKEKFMNANNEYINNIQKKKIYGGPYSAAFISGGGRLSDVKRKIEGIISKYISETDAAFNLRSGEYCSFVNKYLHEFEHKVKRFILTAIVLGKIEKVNSIELNNFLNETKKSLETTFANILCNEKPNLTVNAYLNVDYRIIKDPTAGFFEDAYLVESKKKSTIGVCDLETLHDDFQRGKKNFEDSCFRAYKETVGKVYNELLG